MVRINSSLRRTALAAAAAASLSLPAAAQSDAALSVALGAMHAPLATLAQLKTQSQAPAPSQVKGPAAPPDAWKKILDKVNRDGVKGADADFFTQSLTVSSGDSELGYEVHRVTVLSYLDANKNFRVVGVEFSLERGTLVTAIDAIGTDYWDILADSSGEAGQAIYKQSVYVPGTGMIPGTPVLVDLADPRVKARFDEMLRFWSTR